MRYIFGYTYNKQQNETRSQFNRIKVSLIGDFKKGRHGFATRRESCQPMLYPETNKTAVIDIRDENRLIRRREFSHEFLDESSCQEFVFCWSEKRRNVSRDGVTGLIVARDIYTRSRPMTMAVGIDTSIIRESICKSVSLRKMTIEWTQLLDGAFSSSSFAPRSEAAAKSQPVTRPSDWYLLRLTLCPSLLFQTERETLFFLPFFCLKN